MMITSGYLSSVLLFGSVLAAAPAATPPGAPAGVGSPAGASSAPISSPSGAIQSSSASQISYSFTCTTTSQTTSTEIVVVKSSPCTGQVTVTVTSCPMGTGPFPSSPSIDYYSTTSVMTVVPVLTTAVAVVTKKIPRTVVITQMDTQTQTMLTATMTWVHTALPAQKARLLELASAVTSTMTSIQSFAGQTQVYSRMWIVSNGVTIQVTPTPTMSSSVTTGSTGATGAAGAAGMPQSAAIPLAGMAPTAVGRVQVSAARASIYQSCSDDFSSSPMFAPLSPVTYPV